MFAVASSLRTFVEMDPNLEICHSQFSKLYNDIFYGDTNDKMSVLQ